MTYYFIVLYSDGTMVPLNRRPKAPDHESKARFFCVSGNVTIGQLSEWYATMFADNALIVEIEK